MKNIQCPTTARYAQASAVQGQAAYQHLRRPRRHRCGDCNFFECVEKSTVLESHKKRVVHFAREAQPFIRTQADIQRLARINRDGPSRKIQLPLKILELDKGKADPIWRGACENVVFGSGRILVGFRALHAVVSVIYRN